MAFAVFGICDADDSSFSEHHVCNSGGKLDGSVERGRLDIGRGERRTDLQRSQ